MECIILKVTSSLVLYSELWTLWLTQVKVTLGYLEQFCDCHFSHVNMLLCHVVCSIGPQGMAS